MHLIECTAQKPGLIDKKTLRFDQRLTIIYGKNESGKSLIAKAIIDTLWGEFSRQSFLQDNIWDDFYFEVIFKNSSNRYKFIKDKKKAFAIYNTATNELNNIEQKLLQINFNESARGNTDNSSFLKLFEGTNDSETTRLFRRIDIKTFMNISFLPEPVEAAKNGHLNYDYLLKFLLNDNTNFYSLYENILCSFTNDNSRVNINNSLINEILRTENEVKEIQKKIEIQNLNNSKLDRLKKERTRLKTELIKFEEELLNVRKQKEKLLNIQKNSKKLDEIRGKVLTMNQEKGIEQKKIDAVFGMEEKLKTQYPQFWNFKENNIQNLKKIQETYRDVRDIYEEIEKYYQLRREKKNRFKNIIIMSNILLIIILSAILGINYIYHISRINIYKVQFIAGFLTLSILSPILFLLYTVYNSRSYKLKQILKRKFNIEKNLEIILKENNIILNEYKLEAIYEYLVKYFEEYGEYSINQSEMLKMKDAIRGKEYIKTIDEELTKYKLEENTINEEIYKDIKSLKDNSTINIDTEKINELLYEKKRTIQNYKENIVNMNNFISQIDKEISNTRNDEIKSLNLIQEKNNIHDVLKRLNSYKSSFELMLNLFNETIEKREDKLLSNLSKNAADIFHFLTNNQYIEMIKDDSIKKIIKNEINEKELNISVIYLIMLSIKFALTNKFNDLEINLPLIIDEPFQQMDEFRINKFRQILNDISQKRQIIIFTHSSQYKDWGAFEEL